jgi:hypothetical protein
MQIAATSNQFVENHRLDPKRTYSHDQGWQLRWLLETFSE